MKASCRGIKAMILLNMVDCALSYSWAEAVGLKPYLQSRHDSSLQLANCFAWISFSYFHRLLPLEGSLIYRLGGRHNFLFNGSCVYSQLPRSFRELFRERCERTVQHITHEEEPAVRAQYSLEFIARGQRSAII